MASSSRSSTTAMIAGAVALGVATGIWLMDQRGAVDPGSVSSPQRPAPDATPALRIAEQGRASLALAELPAGAPLAIALDLSDALRGVGHHSVRVVSEHGSRIDTTARPLPGAGSGLQLEIDRDALRPGRYLIEVDVEGTHPLRLRRYVLELH